MAGFIEIRCIGDRYYRGVQRFEMEAEPATVPPVKRRRGRPRKSEVAGVTPGGESGGEFATPQKSTDPNKQKRPRKKKGETPGGAPTIVDVSLIGQQVTGVLDGTFDAGYLLSLRVGNTDTVLRGVVFGPGLSVPITKINDVAPSVKLVRRDDKLVPPKPVAPIPLAFIPSQPTVVLPPPGSIPPTSAVLEAAAAVLTNPASASSTAQLPATGLSAALQQLPGGGYNPEPTAFAHVAYQSEAVQKPHVNVQSGA